MNSNFLDEDHSLIFPISSSTFLKVNLSDFHLNGLLITKTNQSSKESTVDVVLPFDFNLLLSKKPLSQILQILIHNFHPIHYKGSFLLSPLLRGGGGFPSKGSRSKSTKKNTFLENSSKMDTQISESSDIELKKNFMRNYYFFENDQYPTSENNDVKIGPFYEELITVTFDEINKNKRERLLLSDKNFRKFITCELKNQEKKMLETKLKMDFEKNLEAVLHSLVKILKEDLYIIPKTNENTKAKNLEILAIHERVILERLINNSILAHFQVSESDDISTINKLLIRQLIKVSKYLIKEGNKQINSPESPRSKKTVKKVSKNLKIELLEIAKADNPKETVKKANNLKETDQLLVKKVNNPKEIEWQLKTADNSKGKDQLKVKTADNSKEKDQLHHEKTDNPEETVKKPQKIKKENNKKKEITVFKPFHLYIEEQYKKWLETPLASAFNEIQMHVLRKLSWNHYSIFLLVKYYNLSQKSEETVDLLNREFIENLCLNILKNYKDSDDIINASELMELVVMAGIKHEPKHPTISINRQLLNLLCTDINNDIIFDNFKVNCLATIIFQNTSTEDKVSGKLNDDLKQCLNVIHKQIENRLFTNENQNMQDAMDALNIILQIMAARAVNGVRSAKEKTALGNTLTDQMPNLSKQIFQQVTRSAADPSLKIKAKYAQEAIKRLGDEDSALSGVESAILTLIPVVYSLAKGVFTLDVDAIETGLQTILSTGLDFYVNLEKEWYDEVNMAIFLSNMKFEEFESHYFTPLSSKGAKTEDVAYFIARQLYIIARTTARTYMERKKCVEWLGDIYEGKNIRGEKLKFFFFNLSNAKKEIKIYLHKCLSDLARMPKEESHNYEISSLSDLALKVLKRLNLSALELESKFEYISIKAKLGTTLYLNTLKNKLIVEHSLSVLQNSCEEYFRNEICEMDFIEIEGIQYKDKVKQIKRVPLWSKFSDNAFDEFLNNPIYSVMLIQGDAGTGKSVFLKMIEYQQWKRYKLGVNDYIPIYIRLAEINNVSKCVFETLQSMHQAIELVETLKKEKNTRKYLFIFDGYDELKAPKNLYECNKIFEYGKFAKVIITSREEYLKAYGEYSKYFKANGAANADSILLEYRITPLSINQIKTYIQKRVDRDKTKNNALFKFSTKLKNLHNEWTLDKYWGTIRGITGLEVLLKTPYMLKIIIDILPSLSSDVKAKITKSSIYKVFTMKHFETEMNRVLKHAHDQIPKGFDLEKSFYEFSKDLAVNMFLLDKTSVATEGFSYSLKKKDLNELFSKTSEINENQNALSSKESDPFARFFSADAITKLARSGAQLIIFNGQARFTHKSIMEYFAARFFYDELKFGNDQELAKGPLSFKLIYGGGQTNQESDVIMFLKQMIEDNDEKQNTLKGSNELDAWRYLSRNTKKKIKNPEEEIAEKVDRISLVNKKIIKNSEEKIADKANKISLVNENEPENEQDSHVLKKIREVLEKRMIQQYSALFFKNIVILAWMCVPAKFKFISHLTKEEIKDLSEQSDLPRIMRAEIIKCKAAEEKEEENLLKYIELYLGGVYKGQRQISFRKDYIRNKMSKIQVSYHHEEIYEKNAYGEIYYENGSSYKGEWNKLKPDGYGIFTYEANNAYSRYEGFFKGSYFDEFGTLEYANKSIYYGEFCLGDPHGFGTKSFYRPFKGKKDKQELYQIYQIYQGEWRDGLRHGEGVLNLEFSKTSCYKKYYGIWEKGNIKSGKMEFKNGFRITGLYLEEENLFFPEDINIFSDIIKSETIVSRPIHELLYITEIAELNEINIPNFDELMKVDSLGNSVLFLLLQKSNLNMFKTLIVSLKQILSNKVILPNNKGDNFVHMILSNKNPDVNVEIKTTVLKDLKDSKQHRIIYAEAIKSCNKIGMLPLMVALERMSMDKKSSIKEKIQLIRVLTPERTVMDFIRLEKLKTSDRYKNNLKLDSVKEKDIPLVLDPNYLGKYSPFQNVLIAKNLWNENLFKVMLLLKRKDFDFPINDYFHNLHTLFHFREIFLYLLPKEIFFDGRKNLIKIAKNENSNSKTMDEEIIKIYSEFLLNSLPQIKKDEPQNRNIFKHLLIAYIEKFILNDKENEEKNEKEEKKEKEEKNEKEEKKEKKEKKAKVNEEKKEKGKENDAMNTTKIVNALQTVHIKLMIDYLLDCDDFFFETMSQLKLSIQDKHILKCIVSAFLKLKLDKQITSRSDSAYLNFFKYVFTNFKKLWFDSAENWIKLFENYIKPALQKDVPISQEGLFNLMTFVEFSLKFVCESFSKENIEKVVQCLESIYFIPSSLIYEKIICCFILGKKDQLALHFLKKYEGKLLRIQNWHVEFFQYSQFFQSPEKAQKFYDDMQWDNDKNLEMRLYSSIKENAYNLISNLDLPFKIGKSSLNYKFYPDVKYYFKDKNELYTMGFFITIKKEISQQFDESVSKTINMNYLKGYYKYDEKRMAIIEENNFMVALFSKKMKNVLKYLLNAEIFIQNLKIQVLEFRNSMIIFEVFLENNFLFIEKSEVIKNFAGQGTYVTVPNYHPLFNNFLFKEISKALLNKSSWETVLKDPKMLLIIQEFFVPSLKFEGFLNIFMNSLVNTLLSESMEKGKIAKMLSFFLDFSKTMKDFIHENDYSEFVCDFYFVLESKLRNSVIKIKIQEINVANTNLVVLKEEIQKREKIKPTLESSLQAFNEIEKEYIGKCSTIEKKKLEIRSILKNQKSELLLNRLKENQDKIVSYSDIDFYSHRGGRHRLFGPANNITPEILSLVIIIIYQKEEVLASIEEDVLIFKEKSVASKKSESDKVETTYPIAVFLKKIKEYKPDPLDEVTLLKIEDSFQNLQSILRGIKKKNFDLWEFIKDCREILLEFKQFREQIGKNAKQFEKMEGIYLVKPLEFHNSLEKNQKTIYSRIKNSQEIQFLNAVESNCRHASEKITLKNLQILKKEAKDCFNILIDYFFSTVWNHLFQMKSRKPTQYLFEWWDRWLSPGFYQAKACELLVKGLIEQDKKLDEFTPFGSYIYERLLVNCMENDLTEQSLLLLNNFKPKIKAVKSWKIWKTDEKEEEIKEEKKEEKNEEKKKYELKGDHDDKSIILVEAPSEIYIKSLKVLQKLQELKVDYEEHVNKTIKNWCISRSLEEINTFIPLSLFKIREKFKHCSFNNYLWLLMKKFISEQKVINYLLVDLEGKKLLKLLVKQVLDNEQSLEHFTEFLLKEEQDPTQRIQNILNVLDDEINLETFKIGFLKFCSLSYSKNTSLWGKIIKIFQEHLLKNEKLVATSSIGWLTWLMFFMKNPEIIALFEEGFNQILSKLNKEEELRREPPIMVNGVLKIKKEEVESCSVFHWFLIKYFLLSYVKNILTESKIKDYVNRFFNEKSKVYLRSPQLDFLEQMIYNLSKSIIKFYSVEDQANINKEYLFDKPFFFIISTLLGYEINVNPQGLFILKKVSSKELMKASELLILKSELLSFSQFSMKKILPKAFTYKKQTNFLVESGIKLPEAMDILSLFVFLIDLLLTVLIIDDIETEYICSFPQKDIELIVKFEQALEKVAPIDYQSDKKLLIIHFKWEPFEQNTNFLIFKANTENFWDIKALVQTEAAAHNKNTFVSSMEILNTWYFDDESADDIFKDLMKKETNSICRFFIDSKEALLVELIVYNCFINYVVCVENQLNQKIFLKKLEKLFDGYKGDCPLLFDIILETYGYSREANMEKTICLKKKEVSFSSFKFLIKFQQQLKCYHKKMIDHKNKRINEIKKISKDYYFLNNNLKIEPPANISRINFCICTIDLAIFLINLHNIVYSFFEEKKINIKNEKLHINFEICKEVQIPEISYSNLNGIKKFIIYYRFDKNKNLKNKFFDLNFGQINLGNLKDKILMSQEEKDIQVKDAQAKDDQKKDGK